MEPEELERLVKQGPTALLIERLAPLDKAQRGRLSRTARALQRAYWKSFALPSRERPPADEVERIALAQLGVCPASSLRDVHWGQDDASAVAVLCHRDREMLDAWLAKTLETDFPAISWGALQELIRLGACSKPTGDGYIRNMLPRCNVFAYGRAPTPLSQTLLDDPELLEDVWRLFEVENHTLAYDWAKQKTTDQSYETWGEALLKLAAAGHLDRQRLLSATLSALWISDNASVLGGYRRLHEALRPTLDEAAARLDAYAELLSHRTPHVAGFALKQIVFVAKKREVPAADLLEKLRPVFSLKQKGHAVTAVKLISLLLKDGGAELERASEVLIEALLHPHADVQAAALAVLGDRAQRLSQATRARLAELGAEISPLVRERLAALVGDDASTAAASSNHTPEVEVERWLARLEALPAPERAKRSLPEGASCRVLDQSTPPPRRPDFRELGDLRHREPVTPIADVEQLIDAVAHAIEAVDSATELERILDGISRLCDLRGPEFDKRTAPLLHRVKHGGGERGLSSWQAPRALTDLVCTWIEGEHYVTPTAKWMTMHGPVRFQQLRLRELAVRVLQRTPSPLLSAPTHDGGFIDPRVLVARLGAVREAGQSPLETDLVQALLRLAVSFRDKALEAASALPGNVGEVVRYALGGAGPAARHDATSPLWSAAAKARAPDADAPCAASLRLPNAGPVAHYTWMPWIKESKAYGTTYRTPALTIEVEPPFSRAAVAPRGPLRGFFAKLPFMRKVKGEEGGGDRPEPTDSYPAALLLDEHETAWSAIGSHTEWGIEWQSLAWPLDTDAFCARGARAMVLRLDMDASNDAPNHIYLKPLFEPGRPWSELALLALWVALSSKDADLRATAVDLLIAGVDDGRADALGEVAGVSLLHAAITGELLERYLAGLETLPRGGHRYLELLHTLLSQLARPLRPEARPLLESLTGSSKGAKLARGLLSLAGDARGQREANLMAWRAAIERAEASAGEPARAPAPLDSDPVPGDDRRHAAQVPDDADV